MIGTTSVFLMLVLQAKVPPPPLPEPNRQVALERREVVRGLDLAKARFLVSVPLESDGSYSVPVELSEKNRTRLLETLDEPETYDDQPGVMGCIGKEFILTVVWSNHQTESWFSSKCQRIFAADAAADIAHFDVALSKSGAEAVRKILATVVRTPSF